MCTYAILITVNFSAHMLGILLYNPIIDIVLWYLASGARLIIVYMELCIRLNRGYMSNNVSGGVYAKMVLSGETAPSQEQAEDNLEVGLLPIEDVRLSVFEQIDDYMHRNYAWRDPDISVISVVEIMKTTVPH